MDVEERGPVKGEELRSAKVMCTPSRGGEDEWILLSPPEEQRGRRAWVSTRLGEEGTRILAYGWMR